MLLLKEILFRHHRFKVAMFFFCFEASLAILSNQVNDRYISSIMNNSRVLSIIWEERNFISRNRIACNTSKTKRIRCFFHLAWFGSVIANHHCQWKEVRQQEQYILHSIYTQQQISLGEQ